MAHSGWRVTLINTDQLVNNAGGTTQTGVQTYFQTGDGWEGSVFTPNQQFSEHIVRRQIETGAQLLDAIGRMTAEAAE